nr:immunoglobulin light chain junction region [Macaca mulatta]
CLQSKDLPYSF